MLERDPSRRLGAGPDDAEEVKRHPFFSDINWDRLAKKSIPPPFKPVVRSDIDVSNFDAEFTSELAVDSLPNHPPLPSEIQDRFKGFTFHGDDRFSTSALSA